MEKAEEVRKRWRMRTPRAGSPVSVIIAARNEAKNLPRCLQALRDVGEVYVIDSQSTDDTVEIARSFGAQVVQFHYQGGWPKKRQWAMDTLPIAYDWILLLDADEVLTPNSPKKFVQPFRIQPSMDIHPASHVVPGSRFAPRRCRPCGSWHYFAAARDATNAA
jgi:glycosyltransferase involved in cell wall biosynthesis